MEGRAVDRVARQGWAWMLPAFGIGFAVGAEELTGADRLPYAVAGLTLGATWQLLYRRDLTSRLTFSAVVFCLVVGRAVVSGQAFAIDDEDPETQAVVLYSVGVLAGLVFAEQYLRRRDRLRPAEAPAPTPESARP